MVKINEFYRYLIGITLTNELFLNNLSLFFSYQREIDSGISAKSYINDTEPFKTFQVVYENERVKSLILFPKTKGLKYSLNDFKEYLNCEYKVFNNSRDKLIEFVFKISPYREIRFIVYSEIIPNAVLRKIKDGRPILENDIICDEIEIKFIVPLDGLRL